MSEPHRNKQRCGSGVIDFSDFLQIFVYNRLPGTIIFLSVLLIFSVLSPLQAAPLTPDKDIIIVNKQAEEPLWKKWWDAARMLAQEQRYDEAIEKYQAVLKQKPHIEEVSWELCKLYIAVEDYEQASILLDSLT